MFLGNRKLSDRYLEYPMEHNHCFVFLSISILIWRNVSLFQFFPIHSFVPILNPYLTISMYYSTPRRLIAILQLVHPGRNKWPQDNHNQFQSNFSVGGRSNYFGSLSFHHSKYSRHETLKCEPLLQQNIF